MVAFIGSPGVVVQSHHSAFSAFDSLFSDGVDPVETRMSDGRHRSFNALIQPYSTKLYDMASDAVQQSMKESPDLALDAVVLGSSSDSYSAREHQWLVADQVPSLARYLAAAWSAPKFMQFANACAASSHAIATAADLIQDGLASHILVGGADEVTAGSIDGFAACRIYADRCKPFDQSRRGLVLGDGAAFVRMTKDEYPFSEAKVTGVGLASGGDHMVRMSSQPVAHAIVGALMQAEANSVDFVIAHGTGTVNNDQAESKALAYVFGSPGPWCTSYKGGFGHVQGASGAMGVALALMTMRHRVLFPTVGCDVVDMSLPNASRIVQYPTHFPTDRPLRGLILSHGTWGVYSAIVLESL